MNFKNGVSLRGVQWPMIWALGVASFVRRELGGSEMTVTSTTDGVHPAGALNGRVDLHYTGNAADIRTNDWEPHYVADWHGRLKKFLFPLGYDVVLEKDHMHVEYDPKLDAGRTMNA